MKKQLLILTGFFCIFLSSFSLCDQQKTTPFVTFQPQGQLGNLLFETAAAHALAWENGAQVYLPETISQHLRDHVFFRCTFKNVDSKDIFKIWQEPWKEPHTDYIPILYSPNIKLKGYFQSEKFFLKYRQKLLSLFAPNEQDENYLEKKYKFIFDHPCSVGVQLRYYKWEDPQSRNYPQYGKEYLAKAMARFPKESLFVVSSNNISFVKQALPSFVKNCVFLEDEPNYIDLFVLSRCKHNIITNSSFGWWAAWLNANPGKIIFYPKKLFYYPNKNYTPDNWKAIRANSE